METTLYRYFDKDKQLLYVGITGNNAKRQSQHNRDSDWFKQAASATFERYENRSDALEAEKQAIQSEKPLYNKQHTKSPSRDFDMKEVLAKYHFLSITSGIDITGKHIETDEDHALLKQKASEWDLSNEEFGWSYDECLAWELYSLKINIGLGRIKIDCFDTCAACNQLFETAWYKDELDSAIRKLKIARKMLNNAIN